MAYNGSNSRGLNDYYSRNVTAVGGGGGGGSSYMYGRLQSPPVKLHWCGFTGDTFSMQRAGWRFDMYRDPMRFSDTIVAYHPSNKTYLKVSVDDIWRELNGKYQHHIEQMVPVHCDLAKDIIIHGQFEPTKMVMLDMEPKYTTEYISKYNLFRYAVPEVEQQIIIPKELSVDEMLQSILDKQNPNQVEYFKNKVKNKERVDYSVSAQIIKLRA